MRTAGLPRPPDDTPGTVQHRGDVAAGWAAAEVTAEATYTTPQATGNPLGPLAAGAFWDGARLTVHDSWRNLHSGLGGGSRWFSGCGRQRSRRGT